MHNRHNTQGFTLIEIAIVLLVITILLGYTVAMFPVQQELKQYRQSDTDLDQIIEQLIGFAQINGRLPCPDIDPAGGGFDPDGEENRVGTNDCVAFYGYLPARTLSMYGNIDDNGLLLDPWGEPYRYAVSESNANVAGGGNADIDFVTASGIRDEGIANAIDPANNRPDLYVCDDSNAVGNDANCGDVSGDEVVENVAAIVLSTGKDRNQIASNIQVENTDDFEDGTNDKVFISASRNDSAGNEYDDVVRWLSANTLISRMIQADQLP